MELSKEARHYLENLWGVRLRELETKRDSGLARVRRGLMDHSDIYAQRGFGNYIQPELDHLKAIGVARSECWLKAFNLYGQQLTQEAIEEALLDASLHMGRTANALFERKKNEIQSMKPIPPCFTSQPIPAQSELSSQLEEIQREAKHQLRQELTKQMYERRGHEHLASKAQASASTSGTVFHGDQINNYGQAGAIGRHSQGVVNLNERWKEIEQDTDLQVLALELDRLRTAYRKVASSREDDKQVALLGDAEEEAEKGNGRNMAAILSKVGRNVLNVAKDIGTDVAAKVIVELMKAD